MDMNFRDYYTVGEVATMLQITSRAVRKLVERGRFPNAYRIDPDSKASQIRIPKTDYAAFLGRRHPKNQG